MFKEKQKSLKLNFVMNVLLTISSVVFPLITFPYISRILLPEGTGKVSLAISVISYFVMLSQLGIPTYGIRACAQVRDNKESLTRTAQELLIINVIMSVISYLLLILAIVFVPRLRDDKVLYIIISTNIILNAIGMEWLYKALEQYTYITIRSLIFKIIAVLAMFLLIHQQSDYVIYGGITIVAGSASYILNFINARKYISLKPIGKYNFKKHIKATLVFFAISCAAAIYTNMDTVMLGFMKTDVDVGYYNAAIKIKGVLVGVVTSLGGVLLPRVSYYIEKGYREEFRKICKKAINFTVLIAVPFTIYFIIYAKYVILFLSGPSYEGAIFPMQIIMPTIIFLGFTNILGVQILTPLGKEKQVLYAVIIGAVIDLILNIIFIPIMGAAGASLGTLVAEVVAFIYQFVVVGKEIRTFFYSIKYWKILIGVIFGTVSSFWVLFFNISNFLILIISAILFFGAYYASLLLTKENLVLELTHSIYVSIKEKNRRNNTHE